MLMARRVSTAGACFGQKADDLTLQRDRDFGGSFWCGESWGLGLASHDSDSLFRDLFLVNHVSGRFIEKRGLVG
jgi:hypothetical protein